MFSHCLGKSPGSAAKYIGFALLCLASGAMDVIPWVAAAEPPAKPAPESHAQPVVPQFVVDTALTPGVGHTAYTIDPRAAQYYDNPQAVQIGKALFYSMNCAGCHSNGGLRLWVATGDTVVDSNRYARRLPMAGRMGCPPGPRASRTLTCGIWRPMCAPCPCPPPWPHKAAGIPRNHRRPCHARWMKTRAGQRLLERPPTTRRRSRAQSDPTLLAAERSGGIRRRGRS